MYFSMDHIPQCIEIAESIFGEKNSQSTRVSSDAGADVLFWCCRLFGLISDLLLMNHTRLTNKGAESKGLSVWGINYCVNFSPGTQFYEESFNHNWFSGNRISLCLWCCDFLVSSTLVIFFALVISLKIFVGKTAPGALKLVTSRLSAVVVAEDSILI